MIYIDLTKSDFKKVTIFRGMVACEQNDIPKIKQCLKTGVNCGQTIKIEKIRCQGHTPVDGIWYPVHLFLLFCQYKQLLHAKYGDFGGIFC